MHVILKMEGEPAIPMSFERFAQENDLTGEWRDEILGAIDIHGVFQGGGGAQPTYTVTKDTRTPLERINAVTWGDIREAADKRTLQEALAFLMPIAGIESGDVAGIVFRPGDFSLWQESHTAHRLRKIINWLDIELKYVNPGKPKLVLCRSTTGDGGWSLHAPGSTDEQIACGDAPPLLSGPAGGLDSRGQWDRPDATDYAAASAKAWRIAQPRLYGVWCAVSGGITGSHANWMKGDDGQPARFTKDEADKVAKEQQEKMARNTKAQFSYVARML